MIELHCESQGSGEPLLFLHGFGGRGSNWRYIFKEPPAGFRLIAPDLRGHGESPGLDLPFTFRQSAEDVFALLDRFGIGKVRAIGLSGGGITLLHMATQQRDRIDAMVVVSAPPYFPEKVRAIQRQYSAAMLGPGERSERQVEWIVEQTRAMAERTDDADFPPSLLRTITARTLIVFGDADPLYDVGLAHELHEGIPPSSLWIVPNGGHGPVFGTNAQPFVERAMSFLLSSTPRRKN